MEFEKILRERFYKQTLENLIRDFSLIWNDYAISKDDLSSERFRVISSAYSIYLDNKMKNIPDEELFKLCDEFDDAISSEALNELKKNVELSEQEKSYIMYKSMYRERCSGFF